MENINILINHFLEEMNFCIRYNQPFSSATQSLSERISTELFGFKIDPKKGYSYDTDSNDELKSCEYLQPKVCKKCNSILNYFGSVCDCGSKEFTYNDGDSRWGIDSSAHFKHFDDLNRYILFLVECVDVKNQILSIKGWIVNKHSEHFNFILKNQFNSPKSKHLNFLPYSHDFFMSDPQLFLDITFSNSEIKYNFVDIDNPKEYLLEKSHFQHNSKILDNKQIINLLESLNIKPSKNKNENLTLLFQNLPKIKMSELGLNKRTKSLGKDRGLTKR